MGASIVPFVQNLCLAVLTAKNKRLFRSIMLFCVAITNVFLSYVLINRFGIIGAPLGTAISLLVGNTVGMNLYYRYAIGLNVKRILSSIGKGILYCLLISTALLAPTVLLQVNGFFWLALKGLCFCFILGLLLWRKGLNKHEKETVINHFIGTRRINQVSRGE